MLLPVTIDGKAYQLETSVLKLANATGRLPIALIAHGRTKTWSGMRNEHTDNSRPTAREFAQRGWLAVTVIRRGYGRSNVPWAGSNRYICENPKFAETIIEYAKDYKAALEVIATRPDADPDTVIAVGNSLAGTAMIGLAGLAPQGLKAAINLAGTDSVTNCRTYEPDLLSALAKFGATSRVPTLWLYAENDSISVSGPEWNLPAVKWGRSQFEAFTRAGGQGQFFSLGSVGNEGHMLGFGEGLRRVLPRIDQFLRKYKLPTWDEQLVAAVLERGTLASNLRGDVEEYLGNPCNKTLAVSASGHKIGWWGTVDPLSLARTKALRNCEEQTSGRCHILLENFAFSNATA